jgi:hypothetical protein
MLWIEFDASSSDPGITQWQSTGSTGFPACAEIMAGSARPCGIYLKFFKLKPKTHNLKPKTRFK